MYTFAAAVDDDDDDDTNKKRTTAGRPEAADTQPPATLSARINIDIRSTTMDRWTLSSQPLVVDDDVTEECTAAAAGRQIVIRLHTTRRS